MSLIKRVQRNPCFTAGCKFNVTLIYNFNPLWIKFGMEGVARIYRLILSFIEISSMKAIVYVGVKMTLYRHFPHFFHSSEIRYKKFAHDIKHCEFH